LPVLPDEPNCRCYDTPVLHPPEEFENDPALRAEFQNAAGNAIPDPQVYSQWFDRADVGRRKMAVGAKRYDAVRKKLGRTPGFTDFIGTDGAVLPIDHLRRETVRDRELRLSAVSQQMLHRQALLTKASRFGFVSPNNQSPAVSPFHRGITAPVSKALGLQGTKKQKGISATVLGVIDAIHGDGDLPEIPLGWSKSTKWNGAMKFSVNKLSGEMTATSISVSTISPHPHMTVAHEIGHFLDQQGIGSRRFASVDPKFSLLFKAFNDAIAGSDSFQVIQKLTTLNLSQKTKEHLAYIQQPEELFARAYAQWVATKSKNKTFAKELDDSLPKSGTIPHQWSHDDFRPIAASLDSMFRELGWLK